MRHHHLLLSMLLLTASACMNEPDEEVSTMPMAQHHLDRLRDRSPASTLTIAADELIQHTCALYVAVRSHAWDDQISFGREMDGSAVHWNTCPGGTMVACKVMPTANGDSVISGIPLQ